MRGWALRGLAGIVAAQGRAPRDCPAGPCGGLGCIWRRDCWVRLLDAGRVGGRSTVRSDRSSLALRLPGLPAWCLPHC
ncbi:hypothetical protein NDU88_009121 [Pleurodeles waltl]|uniref:Secreted protein n=1 Tax=Pleurodeles waltl TaxID=8319 RepID=A0AAV7QRR3_PLEWA|nr:hypothetical protein NDU88_009121 [Pleurodeles waltl]